MTTIKDLDERIKKLKQDMKELNYLQIEPSHCQVELKLLKEWRDDLIEKKDELHRLKILDYTSSEVEYKINELFGSANEKGVENK